MAKKQNDEVAEIEEESEIPELLSLSPDDVYAQYGSAESIIEDLSVLSGEADEFLEEFDLSRRHEFYEKVWEIRADTELILARLTFGEMKEEVPARQTTWKAMFHKTAKTPRKKEDIQMVLEQAVMFLAKANTAAISKEWDKVYRNCWKAKELLTRFLQKVIPKNKA